MGISDSSGETPRFLPPGEFLFPPHISGPWGGNFYFPPTFRDPGGEVKKALPPHMERNQRPPEKLPRPGPCFRIMDFSNFGDPGLQKSFFAQI